MVLDRHYVDPTRWADRLASVASEKQTTTVERLREVNEALPFQPFVIHLADGKEIPVHHREFMMTVPRGRTVVVCQPDGRLKFLDILMITNLEIRPELNGTGQRRRRR
jgi:hypothetical protein